MSLSVNQRASYLSFLLKILYICVVYVSEISSYIRKCRLVFIKALCDQDAHFY